jgi:hypothetical protein
VDGKSPYQGFRNMQAKATLAQAYAKLQQEFGPGILRLRLEKAGTETIADFDLQSSPLLDLAGIFSLWAVDRHNVFQLVWDTPALQLLSSLDSKEFSDFVEFNTKS